MPHVATSYTKKQVKSPRERRLNSNSENTYVEDARPIHHTYGLLIYRKCKPYSQVHRLGRKNSVQSTVTVSYFSGHGVTHSAGALALPSDPQIPPRRFQHLGRKGWLERVEAVFLGFHVSVQCAFSPAPAHSRLSCTAGSGTNRACLRPHGAS